MVISNKQTKQKKKQSTSFPAEYLQTIETNSWVKHHYNTIILHYNAICVADFKVRLQDFHAYILLTLCFGLYKMHTLTQWHRLFEVYGTLHQNSCETAFYWSPYLRKTPLLSSRTDFSWVCLQHPPILLTMLFILSPSISYRTSRKQHQIKHCRVHLTNLMEWPFS